MTPMPDRIRNCFAKGKHNIETFGISDTSLGEMLVSPGINMMQLIQRRGNADMFVI
jgi:hypothetical protein